MLAGRGNLPRVLSPVGRPALSLPHSEDLVASENPLWSRRGGPLAHTAWCPTITREVSGVQAGLPHMQTGDHSAALLSLLHVSQVICVCWKTPLVTWASLVAQW